MACDPASDAGWAKYSVGEEGWFTVGEAKHAKSIDIGTNAFIASINWHKKYLKAQIRLKVA